MGFQGCLSQNSSWKAGFFDGDAATQSDLVTAFQKEKQIFLPGAGGVPENLRTDGYCSRVDGITPNRGSVQPTLFCCPFFLYLSLPYLGIGV